MDTGFPAERMHFFQVSIKLGLPFPAPELRTRILLRRVKATPDPNTCEKVSRYTSYFYGILLQMYALPVAGSSIYTTNLYHDTPPICIAILFAEVLGSGVVGTLPIYGHEDLSEMRGNLEIFRSQVIFP